MAGPGGGGELPGLGRAVSSFFFLFDLFLFDSMYVIREDLELLSGLPGQAAADQRTARGDRPPEGPSALSGADGQGRPFRVQHSLAMLFAYKGNPALNLFDENRYPPPAMLRADKTARRYSCPTKKSAVRAMLGASATVTPDGKPISYPESSILLYGPGRKIIWQAPR